MSIISKLDILFSAKDETGKPTKSAAKNLEQLAKASEDMAHRMKAAGEAAKTAVEVLAVFEIAKTGIEIIKHLGESFAEFAKTQYEAILSSERMAKELGTNANNLRALQLAAEESDVSMESLESAMIKGADAVSTAAKEGGKAAAALAELGLNAYELEQLSPDQQLIRMAEALGEVGNQSAKIRIARDLFGRGGAAILPVIENLSQAGEKAKLFGLTLSKDATEGVEHLHKAIVDLGARIKGVFIQLIGGSAKQLGDIIETIGKKLDGIGVHKIAEHIAAMVNQGIDYINALINAIGGIEGAFLRVSKAISTTQSIFLSLELIKSSLLAEDTPEHTANKRAKGKAIIAAQGKVEDYIHLSDLRIKELEKQQGKEFFKHIQVPNFQTAATADTSGKGTASEQVAGALMAGLHDWTNTLNQQALEGLKIDRNRTLATIDILKQKIPNPVPQEFSAVEFGTKAAAKAIFEANKQFAQAKNDQEEKDRQEQLQAMKDQLEATNEQIKELERLNTNLEVGAI